MAYITVGSVGVHLPNTDITKLVDQKRLDVLVKSGIVIKTEEVKPAAQKS